MSNKGIFALQAQAVGDSPAATMSSDAALGKTADEVAAKVAQVYERCGFVRDPMLSQV